MNRTLRTKERELMSSLLQIKQTFSQLKEYRELLRRKHRGVLQASELHRLKELRKSLDEHFIKRSPPVSSELRETPVSLRSLAHMHKNGEQNSLLSFNKAAKNGSRHPKVPSHYISATSSQSDSFDVSAPANNPLLDSNEFFLQLHLPEDLD